MKVDHSFVKSQREKRAWSQGHLSDVSGLGLRTIQRIEKTGLASYESAQALASVFAIDVADLRHHAGTGSSTLGAGPTRNTVAVVSAVLAPFITTLRQSCRFLPMACQACIGIRRPVESGCWNYGGYGNPKERRDVSPRLAASRRRRDSE
jgi:hypothetical protein